MTDQVDLLKAQREVLKAELKSIRAKGKDGEFSRVLYRATQDRLRSVKSRLYYWIHNDRSSSRKKIHAQRRMKRLRGLLETLRALPADQPVNLSKTAAQKARDVESKLAELMQGSCASSTCQ